MRSETPCNDSWIFTEGFDPVWITAPLPGKAVSLPHTAVELPLSYFDKQARGEVLSQAVARNMVVCPDGEIGFIDFEDDPASHLPHAVCMARDALNYAQSTALFLQQAGAMAAAQRHWAAFVQQLPNDARQVLQSTVKKLSWVRFLPRSKSLGRDTLRVLAAHDLLAAAPLSA